VLNVGDLYRHGDLTNDWFTATPNDNPLVVCDPSLGFITGGGWFIWPSTGTTNPELAGARVNFGYTMKYKQEPEDPQVSGQPASQSLTYLMAAWSVSRAMQ